MDGKEKRKRGTQLKQRRLKAAVITLSILVLGIGACLFIYYQTQLSLTLNGEHEVTINLNGLYEDPGATAMKGGRDLSDQVQVIGKLDPSVPGTYTLRYRAGNLEVTRQITVTDQMNPEIWLMENDISEGIRLGDEFIEPGYEARDEKGTDLTAQVKVTGTDFKKAGRNVVQYTVSDGEGNTTRVMREVLVLPNTDYDTPGVPICMYHYVYDEEDPPEDLYRRYGNYISVQALEEELGWLREEDYYFPTWKELRDYVDGELILPEKSIVLCFDDGAKSFLENGIPVLERYEVPATCFLITSSDGEEKTAEYKSDYVAYESHSHDMHRAGGYIGHGGIFTAISYEEGMADLERSIEICGSSDAFAYPYGDYNESSRNMVEEAGFLCAVTTEYGKAYPGNDPLLLPRVRMVMGQSLEEFIDKVAPAEALL